MAAAPSGAQPSGPATPAASHAEQALVTVRRICIDHLGIDADRATPDARLVEDLGADSLDLVELVMQVEEALGIEIADDEMPTTIATVGDLAALVAAKLAQVPA